MNIDDIDMKILDILQEDSSTPYVVVAEKVGVTDGTIHQRIKKLKNEKVIDRFTVSLNEETLGLNSLAYILIRVNPGTIESVCRELCKLDNSLEVHEIHTRGDLLVKIRTKSPDEIRNIIVEKIRKIDGVVDTEVFPVFKAWKEENMIRLESLSDSAAS